MKLWKNMSTAIICSIRMKPMAWVSGLYYCAEVPELESQGKFFIIFYHFSFYYYYFPTVLPKNNYTKVIAIPKHFISNINDVTNPANSPQNRYFYFIILICHHSISIVIWILQLRTSLTYIRLSNQELSCLTTLYGNFSL